MKGWPSCTASPHVANPTRGVSEIRLALRYRSNDSLLRHFKDTSTLYLEIVDYPGEWLLDLPMLAQDYLSWSRQMTGLLQGQRAEWSTRWRQLCAGLDPLAPADEARLAGSPPHGRIICTPVSVKGCTLSSPDALSCPAKWPARRRYSFSHGLTSMPSAKPSWRRPINTATPACCANATSTTAKRW